MTNRKKVKVQPPLTRVDELPDGKLNLEIDAQKFSDFNDAFDIQSYQTLKRMCDTGMFTGLEEEMEELRAELVARGLDVDTLIEVEIDETE